MVCCSSGQTGGDVESLTDCDSVRGLGETTDFLNLVRNLWILQMWSNVTFIILILMSVFNVRLM